MNKFAEWVKKKGVKQRHIADKIGVSTSSLHEILRLDKIPSVQVCGAIREFTDGDITFDDWLDQSNKQSMKTKKIKKAAPNQIKH